MTNIVTEAENEFVALGKKVVAALKSAVASVEGAVLTEADQALAFAKQNEPLVTKALNLLAAVEGGASVVTIIGDVEDEFNTFVSEGGFAHLLEEGKTLVTSFLTNLKTDLANDLASV